MWVRLSVRLLLTVSKRDTTMKVSEISRFNRLLFVFAVMHRTVSAEGSGTTVSNASPLPSSHWVQDRNLTTGNGHIDRATSPFTVGTHSYQSTLNGSINFTERLKSETSFTVAPFPNNSSHISYDSTRRKYYKAFSWTSYSDISTDIVTSAYNSSMTSATTPDSSASQERVRIKDLDDDADVFGEESHALPRFWLDVNDCLQNKIQDFAGLNGEVYGFRGENVMITRCEWTVTVPAGLCISADFTVVTAHKTEGGDVRVHGEEEEAVLEQTFTPNRHFDNLLHINEIKTQPPDRISAFSSSNRLRFVMTLNGFGEVLIRCRFQASVTPLKRRLRLVFESPTNGFLTPFGFQRARYLPYRADGAYTRVIQVPRGSVVMTSFAYLGLLYNLKSLYHSDVCDYGNFDLLTVDEHGNRALVYKKCFDQVILPEVYDRSLELIYVYKECDICTGFKMLFSFHPKVDSPVKLSSGLFNCSVPHYISFKQHLHCNLELECQGGEDEGEYCPFSHPHCNGLAGHGDKCYKLVVPATPVSRKRAQVKCRKEGGDLAIMKSDKEWEAFRKVFQYGRIVTPSFIGLGFYSMDIPDIYFDVLFWSDGTVFIEKNFSFVFLLKEDRYNTDIVFFYDFQQRGKLLAIPHDNPAKAFACQFRTKRTETASVRVSHFPKEANISAEMTKVLRSFVQCPAGFLSHDFLSCDSLSGCWTDRYIKSCSLTKYKPLVKTGRNASAHLFSNGSSRILPNVAEAVSMFDCGAGKTIHYTLVCDFWRDCANGLDERFCFSHNCPAHTYKCKNGQCVHSGHAAATCNTIPSCIDKSDKRNCNNFKSGFIVNVGSTILHTQTLIDKTYLHYDTLTKSANAAELCPMTHFSCAGDFHFCLPLHVRCNGVYDCPGHEDEAECQTYECPNLYRCFASRICVELDHVCDGFPHCPRQDDEMLCNSECPDGCRCQGLAFICPLPFPADRYPELRYLDASHSFLSPANLTNNIYLAWLSLRSCRIKTFVETTMSNLQIFILSHNHISALDALNSIHMPNLRTLDLSYNHIERLCMDFLADFPVIEVLVFTGNPLISVCSNVVEQKPTLKKIDLSNTYLRVFDSAVFSHYPSLEYLNLSFTNIQSISSSGFKHTPQLAYIDLRGLHLIEYPAFLFSKLEKLRTVYAETYRLCCDNMLPRHMATTDNSFCSAPTDVISSCKYLVHSGTHRLLLWISCVLAVMGSSACLMLQVLARSSRQAESPMPHLSTCIFKANLHVSSLLMGLYLACIVSADYRFDGEYAWHDADWTASVTCKAAGFFWLLSRLVSAPMVCLLTLEQFLFVRRYVRQREISQRNKDSLEGHLDSPEQPQEQARLSREPVWPSQEETWLSQEHVRSSQERMRPSEEQVMPSEERINLSQEQMRPSQEHLLSIQGQEQLLQGLKRPSLRIVMASLACVMTWVTGFLLAAIPHVSATSHWHFYGVTGLCFPLFPEGSASGGRRYWIWLTTFYNIALCLPLILGQLLIYRSLRRNAAPKHNITAAPEMAITRCLIPVTFLDGFSWLPFGLASLMAHTNRAVPFSVHSVVAMYLLPLNAAVCPLIFVFSVLAERVRAKERERLLVILRGRLKAGVNISTHHVFDQKGRHGSR